MKSYHTPSEMFSILHLALDIWLSSNLTFLEQSPHSCPSPTRRLNQVDLLERSLSHEPTQRNSSGKPKWVQSTQISSGVTPGLNASKVDALLLNYNYIKNKSCVIYIYLVVVMEMLNHRHHQADYSFCLFGYPIKYKKNSLQTCLIYNLQHL